MVDVSINALTFRVNLSVSATKVTLSQTTKSLATILMNARWKTEDVQRHVSMPKDPFIVLVHKVTSWVLMASRATESRWK